MQKITSKFRQMELYTVEDVYPYVQMLNSKQPIIDKESL